MKPLTPMTKKQKLWYSIMGIIGGVLFFALMLRWGYMEEAGLMTRGDEFFFPVLSLVSLAIFLIVTICFWVLGLGGFKDRVPRSECARPEDTDNYPYQVRVRIVSISDRYMNIRVPDSVGDWWVSSVLVGGIPSLFLREAQKKFKSGEDVFAFVKCNVYPSISNQHRIFWRDWTLEKE